MVAVAQGGRKGGFARKTAWGALIAYPAGDDGYYHIPDTLVISLSTEHGQILRNVSRSHVVAVRGNSEFCGGKLDCYIAAFTGCFEENDLLETFK